MDSIENIVTVGTLIEGKEPIDEVNGEPLEDNCYYVSMHVTLNGVAILPKFKDDEVVHMAKLLVSQWIGLKIWLSLKMKK